MDDMSNLIKQFSEMFENDSIPDNIKGLLNDNSAKSTDDDTESTSSASPFGNIDMNTILKMKSIMDSLNAKNNPSANLLLSLKPYLKDSRKNKVEQYIQLLNMTKMFDMFKDMRW